MFVPIQSLFGLLIGVEFLGVHGKWDSMEKKKVILKSIDCVKCLTIVSVNSSPLMKKSMVGAIQVLLVSAVLEPLTPSQADMVIPELPQVHGMVPESNVVDIPNENFAIPEVVGNGFISPRCPVQEWMRRCQWKKGNSRVTRT